MTPPIRCVQFNAHTPRKLRGPTRKLYKFRLPRRGASSLSSNGPSRFVTAPDKCRYKHNTQRNDWV